MTWGFRKEPERVGPPEDKPDEKPKPKYDDRAEAVRRHGADAIHDGRHEAPPRRPR